VFDSLRQTAKGLRTVAIGAGVAALGVADAVGSVDLSPILGLFVSDSAKLGVTICIVTVIFGVLRYYTTTAVTHDDPSWGVQQFAPSPHTRGIDEGH